MYDVVTGDKIDEDGVVITGFDCELCVWVKEYIIQDGCNAGRLAGFDIRTCPEREKREIILD